MDSIIGADGSTWPIWASILLVVAGSVLVAASARWTVESASRVAGDLKISGSLIGLTVIAAGTSAPEFAVTLLAAFDGRGSISIGNVVGSNIFNLGFILGGVALIRPMTTNASIVWRDGLVLVAATFLLLVFVGGDLRLGGGEGLVLVGALLLYLFYVVTRSHHLCTDDLPHPRAKESRGRAVALDVGRLLGSLVLIAVSARMLIHGATAIAEALGLSDWVIGVTLIAAGTSLPEFAVSLMAVFKGRYGMSLGNIIGSDIFNVLGVLGVTGMIGAVEVESAARASLVGLSLMVVFTLFFMRTGWRLSRTEGFLLVVMASVRWTLDLLTRT